ncbi:DNA polymerase III subunit alpha [Hymenobacter busanensis]|uniref:DNA polymerase III subunit alpha n=1 Tax=Hymenobacter busanensis TaxID=2607656 RepID=A0A7L5A1T7_9BACT|nr:DNA polymerase III subunit alpha [Hymenobacter busanensis]KAA9338410.1 DNA polymerase III subunit alpha [Hymenobacter busanensis]QHJ09163.1 DNA polymerase III subunit alpha [Hymenobacter busanensis]
MPTFSHLHCHTQYSLLDGQASISALMKKAQADGMPAVALTDHGNMFGAFNFVAEANKYNVKPIVGCEFYLVDDRHKKSFSREKGERDVRHHQLLLAKDQAGYQNLAKLCSMSFIEGVYSKYPRIDKELLLQYHEGLIATSCCIGAEIPQALLWKTEAEAEEKLKWWLDVFGEDYYIEIQRHGIENIDNTGKSQEDLNQILLRWAQKYNVKVICTNDSHYVNQEDFAPHDLLLCVNTGEEHSIPVGDFQTKYFRLISGQNEVLYDHLDRLRPLAGKDDHVRRQLMRIDEEMQMPKPRSRFGFPNDQFYFKTQAEMAHLFADVPESLDNTNEIVDKITPPKLARDILLPNFPLPAGFANADEFLRELTYVGAFGPGAGKGIVTLAKPPRYAERTPEIEERLEYELRIIQTMGFAGYFLIVQDFINQGRNMGVAVGPGRGSAAGSAVAYCVGITNIDPIKYSLLFERFLNPERVSMPDIDIDFDDVNRQRVIDYVVDKYGKTQVAQIITFGTMAAKSSIKDVARAMELPLPLTNELAKMVPEKPGTTLAGAFAENQELDMIRRDDAPDNLRGQILRLAEKLEGSVRNTGIHAAGVIIAPDDITKYIPVSTSKDSDLLVTQFDGKVIESAGMLKMDFLGLKTLTIIVDALELIKKNHGVDINIDDIPLDDEKTYALYQRGDTIGTFQFESEGMRMYLKDLKPTNIEDLIAMNALYRPGPMQFIPNFINRKHGREEIEYPHELLEPILNYSQGIMVYQEQIMQAAQILAGYSLGGADLLRRAMGKKDMKKMAQEREKFCKGAAELHGIKEKKANEVFDVMEKFAAYGFNRSHSAAYSVVAYQTGYLKANYPAEYMAAVLTNNMSDIKKVTFFIEEARRQSVQVLGPDVNESVLKFNVNEKGQIRFGMAAVKGAGEAAIENIVAERGKKGPFTDIFDFSKRVNLRAVNKKTFESLALSGAFDSFERYHRRQFVEAPSGDQNLIDKAVRMGQQYQADQDSAQQSLFGGGAFGAVAMPLPKVADMEPWPATEQLRREKEVVGFYLSGHPLDDFKLEIDSYCTCGLDKVETYKNRDVTVAGLITNVMFKTTKTGQPFVSFTVEDYESSLNLALFRDDYSKFSPLINPRNYDKEQVPPMFIRGKYAQRFRDSDQFEFKIMTMEPLFNVAEKLANGVRVQLDLRTITEPFMDRFMEAVEGCAGSKKLEIKFAEPHEQLTVDTYSRRYRIEPKEFIRRMREMEIDACQLI